MDVLPFLAVAVVVVITPGVDMALVTKNALVHGRRQALATAFGINVGIAAWTVAAAVFLAAAVQASAAAFAVIKFTGAVPRLRRGAGAPKRSPQPCRHTGDRVRARDCRSFPARARQQPPEPEDRRLLHQPAAAVRQSRDTARPTRSRRTVQRDGPPLADELCAAGRGRVFLQHPRVKSALDYLSGIVLVGLGARLALERHS